MSHPEQRQLGITEIRDRQLGILDAIAEHCEREDLRWYLYAGTLLGAVRHGGYIPWDDDIDLQMPRPDYERFCRTFGGPALSVRSLGSLEGHVLPFAKVCDDRTRLVVESGVVEDIGVFVDVFPLDGWCDSTPLRTLQRWLLTALLNVMRAKHLVVGARRSGGRNAVLRLVQALSAPISAHRLSRMITWVSVRAPFDRRHDVGVLAWGTLEAFPRSAFRATRELSFEGRLAPAPIDTDRVLTMHYGDYHRLPPEDQRVSNHRWTAYEVPEPAARDSA